jgi:hypothetical protein
MFSLTLMSKGEKRCGLDATVGGLRRTVQSFRVSINAKGGYCWHVYRQSVLVIDGKNNNDDGILAAMTTNRKTRKAGDHEKLLSTSSGGRAQGRELEFPDSQRLS